MRRRRARLAFLRPFLAVILTLHAWTRTARRACALRSPGSCIWPALQDRLVPAPEPPEPEGWRPPVAGRPWVSVSAAKNPASSQAVLDADFCCGRVEASDWVDSGAEGVLQLRAKSSAAHVGIGLGVLDWMLLVAVFTMHGWKYGWSTISNARSKLRYVGRCSWLKGLER